jgi:hypothetical protein
MDKYERNDSTEPMLAADPTENTEASEPAEPIDRMDPADPIDRIEPADPIDRIDPVEPIDRIDPADPGPGPGPAEPTADESRLVPMVAFSQQAGSVGRPSAIPSQPPEANLCHQRDGRRCGRGG